MDPVAEQLEIRNDSKDEDECGKGEDDYHMTEHREGLSSRVSSEEERHYICEWHDSKRENGEDPLCWRILLVKSIEERDRRCNRNVQLDRVKDEISDPIRGQAHTSDNLHVF